MAEGSFCDFGAQVYSRDDVRVRQFQIAQLVPFPSEGFKSKLRGCLGYGAKVGELLHLKYSTLLVNEKYGREETKLRHHFPRESVRDLAGNRSHLHPLDQYDVVDIRT